MNTSTIAISGPHPRGPSLRYRLRALRERWFPRDRDSNIIMFAKEELAKLRDPSGDPDPLQDAMEKHILSMCRAFAREGHSGFSASYAIGILEKVLRFEPVTPLTGADDEWNEVGEGRWQNRRCGRVFKGADGRAYDIDGRVFVEPDGGAYTNRDSRVFVTFPYRPATQYVRRPARDEKGRYRKSPSSSRGE